MSVPGLLIGFVVMAAVLIAVSPRHSRPARLVTLLPSVSPTQNRISRTRLIRIPEVLGGWLCTRLGRPRDPDLDRRVGTTVVGLIAGMVIHPVVAVGVVVVIWSVPVARSRREARSYREQVRDQLPDVVDMLRLAVGAGLTVRLAIDAVASRCDGVIGERLREVQRRVLLGQRLHEALDSLGDLGEPVIPLTRALIASDSDGSPLVPSLEQVAAETRLLRRRAAEEDARRLPVKLLFPLVACILPAFILLTVVPLLGGAIRSLGL